MQDSHALQPVPNTTFSNGTHPTPTTAQSPPTNSSLDHYYVLADSGKPIYVRYGDESDHTSLLSMMQVLVAHYDDDTENSNSLRWISLPSGYKIVFLVRRPLILVAASVDRCEPQIRAQLNALHSYILSLLTQVQLSGLFARRPNLDLRPILGPAHHQIGTLCDRFAADLRYLYGCVESIRIPSFLRVQFGHALQSGASCAPNLLYGMILGHDHLINLIRPKSHSLHPSDLLNVFTLVASHREFRVLVGTEHWVPVCLPKFNDQGFLYAHVSYVTPDLGVVLMTSDINAFDEMHQAKCCIHDYMLKNRLIVQSNTFGDQIHTESLFNEPTLKHFVYKSKNHVQFIQVGSGAKTPPASLLQTKYARLNAALHDRETPIKLLWFEHDIDGHSSMGWNSGSCEIYCVWDASITRPTATRNANAIVKWVKANEKDLFILESPTLS